MSWTKASHDVFDERVRQISQEGWTFEHDDGHVNGELAKAAAAYAIASWITSLAFFLWPWDTKWWKVANSRKNLVKAGALIIAEIERLDRAFPDN